LPANVVAQVAFVPVARGRITKREFERALLHAAAAAGRQSPPKPGGDRYERLKEDAIGELLDGVWIRGQATEMGIEATPREVSRQLASLRREAFSDKAEYRAFLREAHYTQRDVRERVEIQILSFGIMQRIGRGLGEAEQREAFRKFVAEYAARWKARTVCAPEFVIERCSNAPAIP
jgi:hypothetical protein